MIPQAASRGFWEPVWQLGKGICGGSKVFLLAMRLPVGYMFGYPRKDPPNNLDFDTPHLRSGLTIALGNLKARCTAKLQLEDGGVLYPKLRLMRQSSSSTGHDTL